MQIIDEKKLNEFAERAMNDLAAGYGGVMVSLGRKLGLYKALAYNGPLSSVEVARRTGCAERYVREWLNSQAASGYVIYHASSKTYELTPEQAKVLADEGSPYCILPGWDVASSMWFDEDKTIAAFRTGKGVAWGDHNERLYRGVAAFYNNAYRAQLVQNWLPALDGVVEKLTAGATVADVGCGHGLSTVIMAEAFPNSRFRGFDTHEGSIEAARENARKAGLGGRVHFEVAGAKGYPSEAFDLVAFFDCLHDMGDPVGAARHARNALADDGTVLAVEPFAHDLVENNLTTVGRLFYAGSTALCLAHSLSEEGGAALGAQAGERRLATVFHKAGFRRFRRAMETPVNLILEARP